MAFADNLVHSMTVMRRSSDADRLGQPRERWSAVATGVACRATTVRGSERNTERMRETYGVTHRVFLLPTATNVGEDDEVVGVDGSGDDVLPRGRVVLKRIVFARGMVPHHLELDCESLRGPM